MGAKRTENVRAPVTSGFRPLAPRLLQTSAVWMITFAVGGAPSSLTLTTDMADLPLNRPYTSRQRYRKFVDDYRHRRLDELTDAARGLIPSGGEGRDGGKRGSRRELLREYLRWLKPHRYRVALVFALAIGAAGMQLVEPLFMRHIIDRVLLNPALDASGRLTRLNLVGGTFLAVIMVSNLLTVLKDYRQKLLNTAVMLTLRRTLFDRFLHLVVCDFNLLAGGLLPNT